MALYLASKGKHVRVYNEAKLQEAIMQEDWCQGDDIDDDYNSLIGKLKECLRKAKGVCPREKKGRISEETTKLLEKRKNMKMTIEDHLEYSILSRVIRQQLKKDFEGIPDGKSLEGRRGKEEPQEMQEGMVVLYRSEVTALKNTDGIRSTRERDGKSCETSTPSSVSLPEMSAVTTTPTGRKNVPPILVSEFERAIGSMKNERLQERRFITSEVLKSGREQLWKILAERFTHYLDEGRIPLQWKESNTILLYKKGDREDLKNYRPICLLSHVYKLFTKIILNRLSRRLDEQQPREQAGFQKNYSTMDHIFALTQLLERANEYKLPLCVVFIDYEKAFDSVETNAVLNSLQRQGIEAQYVQLLREINCVVVHILVKRIAKQDVKVVFSAVMSYATAIGHQSGTPPQ
ncbi:uncharacterized protein LOC115214163 [Octopus sinensis]|uniref:Uncharacterized protein LOC115214163 n=1 Tax=Octopus sinensis TaxID=2607531 RepID=A0A6P7SL03_9MOLL|nr:uncharacterized protein LOC115214163 [Octopus sinensis]